MTAEGAASGAGVASAVRLVLRPVRAAVRAWRRSLQLRVVASTVVISSVAVVLLGLLLLDRVSDGIFEAEVESSTGEVEAGQAYAQRQLQANVGGPTDPGLATTVTGVVSTLASRGGRDARFGVLMRPEDESAGSNLGRQANAEQAQVPDDLVRMVREDDLLAYAPSRQAPQGGAPRPYLVVGAPVVTASGSFELYYFFPRDDEVATVGLVRTTLLATGVVLVLLVAAVALLVTRQVVTPVRLAARTAERLSHGLLEERMRVRGEDDLALLATSFNRMAANLQRQIVQLENLSRLQRRFTSDVSHELRTPLTTVRMAADVLYGSRADFDPAVRRSAELLQAEVDRFETLLTDLLEISRYDAGFAVLEPEPTDVRVLVSGTVSALAPLAARAGATVRVSLPPEPVVAEVDARRVDRILRNLLGNAIEHAEGGPVRIALTGDGQTVEVSVRDSGVGLRPGDERLVFNRFWRGDPSRARQTGGTGLGLSISQEDARLHGGRIVARGRPGQGAEFLLTLPVQSGTRLPSVDAADQTPSAAAPALTVPPVLAGPGDRRG